MQTLVASPAIASKRWIWEQYDHLIGGNTLQRPGGDAAVARLPGQTKALAMVTDCTPRYCLADPETGGAQAVVETWRNLTAVGATPIAITDNLNFGNPERPEIMGQLAGCIRGMKAACLALDYPVVSGNVSLYNETNGQAILPTPVIGGVGLLTDGSKQIGLALTKPGDTLLLIGAKTAGWLGSSLYLREVLGREDGAPPPIDLGLERKVGDIVRMLIDSGAVKACHDLSDGGLLVGVAEMAMAGKIGVSVALPEGDAHAVAFGEDQGRYLVVLSDPVHIAMISALMYAVGASLHLLGQIGGDSLTVAGHGSISVETLSQAHEGWLPRLMAGPVADAAD